METSQFVNLADFEAKAAEILPRNALGYFKSGANDEISLRDSRKAYSRYQLLPNCLVDVSKIDTSVRIFGSEFSMPIGIAPAAMQKMAHPEGEVATARAAAKQGIVMGLSSLSTTSMEEVAASSSEGIKWFQLYVYKDRSVTLSLIRRAERAGYRGLAVTVDAPVLGRREADVRHRFQLPPHLQLGNFSEINGTSNKSTTDYTSDGSGVASYFSLLMDDSLTWDVISWLKSQTHLPVIVKGILTPKDTRLAIDNGADAVWISNHGARQLDTVPAPIDALYDISTQLGPLPVPLFLDGGIMRGTDVVKALALGASMVFIGRPMLWGLTCDGQRGVERVLHILRDELSLAMKLCGVVRVQDLTADLVQRAPWMGRSKL